MVVLDSEDIDRLRSMAPREAYEDLKTSVYRAGAISSEDFQAVFDQLVEAGVLTWDQIEEFERH